jgi:NADPH:quinone reductase-like Zn-dependent oxidoreductase
VRSLGADTVIDYQAQRFEGLVRDVDVVFDLLGGETRERSWQVLKRGGILVSTLGQPDEAKAAAHGVRAKGYTAQPSAAQLLEIRDLIDAGKVRPTVTRTFTLDSASAAQRFLEHEHPRGKIVLSIAS